MFPEIRPGRVLFSVPFRIGDLHAAGLPSKFFFESGIDFIHMPDVHMIMKSPDGNVIFLDQFLLFQIDRIVFHPIRPVNPVKPGRFMRYDKIYALFCGFPYHIHRCHKRTADLLYFHIRFARHQQVACFIRRKMNSRFILYFVNDFLYCHDSFLSFRRTSGILIYENSVFPAA